MEWNAYNGVEGIQQEISKHVQPELRFFHVARKTALYPQEEVKGSWVVCDSNTLKTFSAVGYFFGQRLHDSLQMPVGLINASWGGTPAETWMPDSLINSNATWKADLEKLSKTEYWTITPGYAYNAMIAPLTPLTIDGVIWYQGESNVGAAKSYGGLFSSLIQSWRAAWQKELPFYFVQIAPYTYGKHFGAAQLREEQGKVAATVPHTGMAVVSDLVNDTTNIHPVNKRDVGHRLAALALQDAYGKSLQGYRSKTYAGMDVQGAKIKLRFNGEGNLQIKGKEPVTLLVAGADSVFVPAKAKVLSNVLEVWHPKIKEPKAVRYQFSSAGIGNLYDSYGLPVAPFRTDSWPL
jgi:sialate O-acetylesterase